MTEGSGGPIEQVSKLTAQTVEALKSTPVVLALVIFNVLFMGATVYVSIHNTKQWNTEVERWSTLVQSCLPPQAPR